MVDQRYIPNITVPPEQTNASLRKLLRESHTRERQLRESNKKLLALCNDALAVLNAHAVGHRTQEALEKTIEEAEREEA